MGGKGECSRSFWEGNGEPPLFLMSPIISSSGSPAVASVLMEGEGMRPVGRGPEYSVPGLDCREAR